MADKWLCILTAVKQHPIQEMPGQLFGMAQSHTNPWIHRLHPVLNQALAHHDLRPARTADELAALLATPQSQEGPTLPLVGMMVLNGQSTVRKTLRTSKRYLISALVLMTVFTAFRGPVDVLLFLVDYLLGSFLSFSASLFSQVT